MEGDISQKYTRDINCLKDNDKNIRKQALQRLSTNLPKENSQEISVFFGTSLKRPLLNLLSDSTDICKELSVSLLSKLVNSSLIEYDDIIHILQAICSRLNILPFPESCKLYTAEEVRLVEIRLVKDIIKHQGRNLVPVIEDICEMLAKAEYDSFPDVKNEVSSIVYYICDIPELKVGYYAKSLIPGLSGNLLHQHSKVRTMALEAIGRLILAENAHEVVDELLPLLKKLQYDRTPAVRKKLYSILTDWLMYFPMSNMRTHESKLVYLLLGGLGDLDSSSSILSYMHTCGERRIQLANDFQEDLENLSKHVPETYLILINLPYLLNTSLNDIQEWTVHEHFKKRATTVIFHILRLAQSEVTPHLDSIIKNFFKCYVEAEDNEHAHTYEECMSLIGEYCDFKLIITLFEKYLLSGTTPPSQRAGGLRLFAKCLESEKQDKLEAGLESCVKLLTHEDLYTSEYVEILDALHTCIRQFILQAQNSSVPYLNRLFSVLLTLQDTSIKELIPETISTLAFYCGLSSASLLYAQQLPYLLPILTSNHNQWSSSTIQRQNFRTLLINSGDAVHNYWTQIMKVLQVNCKREKDAEVKFDMLVILEHFLSLESTHELLSQYSHSLVMNIIAQTSAWRPGSANTEIRIASMLCLQKALSYRIVKGEILIEDWDGISPVIKTCLEDDWSGELRKITCKVCETLLDKYGEYLDEKHLVDFYPLLLARLEDSKNINRIEICRSLCSFFRVIKAKLTYFANYKNILKSLFTHLDDSDEQVQRSVSEVLEIALEFSKAEFLEVATEALARHRHPRNVKELINLTERIE